MNLSDTQLREPSDRNRLALVAFGRVRTLHRSNRWVDARAILRKHQHTNRAGYPRRQGWSELSAGFLARHEYSARLGLGLTTSPKIRP